MDQRVKAIMDAVAAKAKKTLDADGNGTVDAADFELMAKLAEIAATKQTDSLAARFGTLPLFGAGVAAGVVATVAIVRMFNI